MISPTAEYALRAMVALADADPNPLITTAMAGLTRVPPGYLPKVLQTLRKSELVESKRGLNGGFTLARRPADISMLDVVNAVDPLRRIEHCPLGIGGHNGHLCPLHRRLDDAIAATERSFANTTLAELVNAARGRPALCAEDHLGRGPISIAVPVEVD